MDISKTQEAVQDSDDARFAAIELERHEFQSSILGNYPKQREFLKPLPTEVGNVLERGGQALLAIIILALFLAVSPAFFVVSRLSPVFKEKYSKYFIFAARRLTHLLH